MAAAMTALATTTLASPSATVTFSSIPATYRDLRLIYTISSANGNQDVGIKFNTVTGTTAVYMAGFGSSTGSGTSSDLLGYVSTAQMLNQADIFDYAQTDKHKSGLLRYGNSANFAAANAFRWASTAAITSIQIYIGVGTFDIGSTFTLYGISA